MSDESDRDTAADVPGSAEEEANANPEDAGRYALDVFGLKLEVANPRLAELLSMDAKEAMTADLTSPGSPDKLRELKAETAEAVPDVVLAPTTPHDEQDAAHRREFRARVTQLGAGLGMDATPDGVWRSPSGFTIVTRAIDKPLSLAAATHFVEEIGTRRQQLGGPDATILFVVEGQQSADVFKVAIRQRQQFQLMRVIRLDDLVELGQWHAEMGMDHSKALVFLTPAADIDAGEIMSVIRAARLNGSR